ncbi:MAG: HAD-IIA family hydrolase [Candidatus Micrarchaeota archaeon]|nr:HAD-IIA family hydrolase [Candidatus Micrarchaeota archaeon]
MVSGIVFDLDGVVYKANYAIPGVAEEIARLQKKVKVLFLTNNATKSRADYVRHLEKFGISARKEEIMTSSFGAAHYLREKYGEGKRVFVIGEQGLKDELALEGKAVLAEEGEADAVVCGLDRQISYEKYERALSHLLAGAAFILANADPTWPKKSGVAPGSGAIAAPLIFASGRQPDFVAGKPSKYLIEKLLGMHSILPSQSAFVGDRLDIDIRMANSVGMTSVLVLTGISKKEDVEAAPASDKPQIVLESAAGVGKALGI